MILPTNFPVDMDKVYLCYLDPEQNALVEINPLDLYLKIKPFEKIIRRFYLVSSYVNSNLVTVVANIDGPQKHAYSVKTRLGRIYSDISSFEYSGNMATISTYNSETTYENAVPIDLLIESFNKTETCNLLDISLSLVNIAT